MAARDTPQRGGRIARNTAIFSIATGLSRIAGLVREIVASSYFGTCGAVLGVHDRLPDPEPGPQPVRRRRAERRVRARLHRAARAGPQREAFRLASTLFVPHRRRARDDQRRVRPRRRRTSCRCSPAASSPPSSTTSPSGLAQVLFPIVLLLGVNGLLVGILNAYDHFTIPALAPLVWNVVIIVLLVASAAAVRRRRRSSTPTRSASSLGTVVQLAMAIPVLRRAGLQITPTFDLRDPRVKRVLALMLPVTLEPGPHQLQPADQLGARRRWSPTRRRARSTPPSASTCCPRACSASPWRPCCSPRSAASPSAATPTACAA